MARTFQAIFAAVILVLSAAAPRKQRIDANTIMSRISPLVVRERLARFRGTSL
jgi:hypothetical protein